MNLIIIIDYIFYFKLLCLFSIISCFLILLC